MTFLFKCPACGHRHRLSDEWLGKEIKCAECADLFTVSAGVASVEALHDPTAKAKKAPRAPILKKILGDPSAALEAAIPGAIGGVLAGIQCPLVAGIVAGQAAGEILGRILTGFVIGFGVGTVLGALAVGSLKRIRPDFRLEPGMFPLVGGAVIGSIVVAMVESFLWIPLGAAIGGAGAELWLLLSIRLESATRLPDRVTSEENLLNGAAGSDRRLSTRKETRS